MFGTLGFDSCLQTFQCVRMYLAFDLMDNGIVNIEEGHITSSLDSCLESEENIVGYNLRSCKGEYIVMVDVILGGLGMNFSKGPNLVGRGRESYIHLAQEKVAFNIVVGREFPIDGVLRALNTYKRVVQLFIFLSITESYLVPLRNWI